MSRILAPVIATLVVMSGCTSPPTNDPLATGVELSFTGCEIAYTQETASEPGGKKISGWGEREIVFQEFAAIEFWNCDQLANSTRVVTDARFAIFTRQNSEPPPTCLRKTDSFPRVIQAILATPGDVSQLLSHELNMPVAEGEFSAPTEANPMAGFSWQTVDGAGGALSPATTSNYQASNSYQNDLVWPVSSGLGLLKIKYETTNTGAVEGKVLGEINWPPEMQNSVGVWLGSSYVRHRTAISNSLEFFETTECERANE